MHRLADRQIMGCTDIQGLAIQLLFTGKLMQKHGTHCVFMVQCREILRLQEVQCMATDFHRKGKSAWLMFLWRKFSICIVSLFSKCQKNGENVIMSHLSDDTWVVFSYRKAFTISLPGIQLVLSTVLIELT